MRNEEITAVFVNERIRWDDTLVGEIQLVNGSSPAEGPVTAGLKGKAEVDELLPNHSYRFYGRWTTYQNKRSGESERQFYFQTFVEAAPHGRAGVIAYLKRAGTGRGIGTARARALWEKYGSDAVRMLREEPEEVAANIRGLSVESAKECSIWLHDKRQLEACTIELTDLLDGRGFPRDTVRLAVKAWGNEAAAIIRKDPYCLMNFRGCGFKRCDQLWLDLGLSPARLRRQAFCAWYAVASNTEGHTWFSVQHAINGLAGQVSGAEIRPAAAIKLAKRIGRLSPDRNGALEVIRSDQHTGAIVSHGGEVWVAEGRKAANEELLAKLVVDSMSETSYWPNIDELENVSDHQREHLCKSLVGTVGILGGGPGTGKTYTAARVISKLIDTFGIDQIAVGCPTGKAAVRISEAMQQYGIGLRARTWHSLLGIDKVNNDGGGWSFAHNESNPLPYKVLIGDESSMLDTNIMCSIFRARAAGTHFLLIGDTNQLPPVGHGAPLRDLIAAGLPYGELTEIKRNSGGIVEACAAIRDDKKWQPGDNLVFHEMLTDETTLACLVDVIKEHADIGFDPVWDCQVVVAVNDKSKLSRKEVNALLQLELNKNPGKKNQPFRVGDKIVNGKNGWFPSVEFDPNDPDTQLNENGEVYVANGELAEVLEVEEKIVIAKLSSPDRVVKIPRGKGDGESSTGCSWELGYALSVHKSQGSEFTITIVLVDEYPGARMVCDRSWVYTAISRAKEKCVLIGQKRTVDRFCRVQKMNRRKTFLAEQVLRMGAERILVEM